MIHSLILIVVAGVLWGTSGIFVHYLAPLGFSSLQMSAVRSTVSLICIVAFALIKNRSLFKINPKNLILFAGIGVSIYATASCYFIAMQMTSVSTAVILMYTAPIFVTIFSAIFFKEKFTTVKLISLIGMMIGCVLVAGIIGDMKFDLVGILVGFASGISYAIYNILTKVAMMKNNNPVSTSIYSYGFMMIIALIVANPVDIVVTANASPLYAYPLLIGLGVCTFILPYFLYTLAMKNLPAGTASALGITEPMFATIFSVTILGETLSLLSTIGIVLILICTVLLGISENKLSPAVKEYIENEPRASEN
ncbi:MAG: EamA family transporter [Clostridia bacterium]|nr:EamA family transporter [Clostridia bacterium]